LIYLFIWYNKKGPIDKKRVFTSFILILYRLIRYYKDPYWFLILFSIKAFTINYIFFLNNDNKRRTLFQNSFFSRLGISYFDTFYGNQN